MFPEQTGYRVQDAGSPGWAASRGWGLERRVRQVPAKALSQYMGALLAAMVLSVIPDGGGALPAINAEFQTLAQP